MGGSGFTTATIYGESKAETGRGVYGYASNSSGTYSYGGVFGSAGIYGRGVSGHASNFEGTNNGAKIKASSICTYQFDGDKCSKHFTTTDRLTMAQQAATGPIAGIAVNAIVKRIEKGLR